MDNLFTSALTFEILIYSTLTKWKLSFRLKDYIYYFNEKNTESGVIAATVIETALIA